MANQSSGKAAGGFDLESFLTSLHTSFEPNAILRGAQLTAVGNYGSTTSARTISDLDIGANRALQNPALFTSTHYRQAAFAVVAGLVIRLIVWLPTLGIRALLKFIGLFTDLSQSGWDEEVVEGIDFVEHSVLQVPFFLMSLVRYLSPAMDDMFMQSLAWVDKTYTEKHRKDDPNQLRDMYYPQLKEYNTRGEGRQRNPSDAAIAFLMRFGKKAALSLGVYLLTFVPYVGRFVLPAASFYTFNKAVGLQPAVLVFASAVVLPKRYLVQFLQSYFSSRSLMRELVSRPLGPR